MKPRVIGLILVAGALFFLVWQLTDMLRDCRVNTKSVGLFSMIFFLGLVQVIAPIDLQQLRKKHNTNSLKFSQYPLYWNVASILAVITGLAVMMYLEFGYRCIPQQ